MKIVLSFIKTLFSKEEHDLLLKLYLVSHSGVSIGYHIGADQAFQDKS